MRDPRLSAPTPARAVQPPESTAPHRRSRRRRLSIPAAFVVGVALLLPPAAASAAAKPAASPPVVGPTATGPCTITVSGFTAAAVETARNKAGVGGIVCLPAGTYTGNVHASVADQTWRLADGARLTGTVYITGAGVTLDNGVIARSTTNRWVASVEIRAHNVTVQSVWFSGGGTGIGVYGKDRARILYNGFRNMTGSAISIWSEGVGADHTLLFRNSIVQSATHQVSPITSRGNEGSRHGGVQNYGTTIRSNTIDQGAGNIGWFGIELKQSWRAIVESNVIRGGKVLVSLPETDRATIRYNTFDLRGSPFWGVEVANAYDAMIDKNVFIGDGWTGVDYAISLNSGSLRTLARANKASNLRTFFAVAGDGHRVTDNCLTSVRFVQEFMLNGGPHIYFARNGPC